MNPSTGEKKHEHEWEYLRSQEACVNFFGLEFAHEFSFKRECFCGVSEERKGPGRLPIEAKL